QMCIHAIDRGEGEAALTNIPGPHGSIIYYDVNHLDYSSYFTTGFYENAVRYPYVFKVSKKLPSLLHEPAMAPWNKLLFSVCLFEAILPNEHFYFCIDARDSGELRDNGYHLPLLRKVRYYFKVNYDASAIQHTPELTEWAAKIVPVAPFFG